MAFQPCPGIAQVEFIYDQFDQTLENVIHVQRGLGFTDEWLIGELEELAVMMVLWWNDNMQTIAPTSLTLREVVCTDLTLATSGQWIEPAVITGTNIQLGLPAGSTLCVSFRTALRGRSYRGRQYYVGLTEPQVSGNSVDEALLPVLVGSYSEIQPYLDDMIFSAEWVVLSRFEDNAERAAGIGTPVESITIVDNAVDSQRRRLTGRGL